MALSGNIGNTFRKGYRLELDWTATQNITNNTSLITSKLYLTSLNRYYDIRSSSTNGSRTIIDGTTYTGSFNPTLKGNQRKLIQTSSKTINHGADGKKSFSIGGSADVNVTLSGNYYGTVNLPTRTFSLNRIPRRSTLTSSPNFDIGNSVKVDITRASSGFTHTVKIYVGTTLIETKTGVGSTWTFTPTTQQTNQMHNLTPNSNSIQSKIVLETYSGGSLLGTVQSIGTARVTNANPVFTNATFTDTNTTLRGKIGSGDTMVQNLSVLQAEVDYTNRATAVKGATMVEYIATMSDFTKKRTFLPSGNHVFDIGKIDSVGIVPLRIRAIDSRGNSTHVIKRINFVAYQEPLLTATAERLNGFENQTTLSLKGLFSPLTIDGVRQNAIRTLRYKAHPKGGSAGFTSVSGITYVGSKFNAPDITLNLDNSQDWVIEIKVDDNVQPGYSHQTIDIKKGVPPWHFEGNGNFRLRGGLITTGDEKTISNNGKSVDRFEGISGTDASLRALKMGDNSSGVTEETNFPSRAGAWVYFQNAENGGAGGSPNADFCLWKNRRSENEDVYIGHYKSGEMKDFGRIETVVDSGTYSRGGTTGSYKKYSDGRLVVQWERTLKSKFVGNNGVVYSFTTPNIYFMGTAFNNPPVIVSNSDKGEIFGFANRQTFNNYFNLRVFSISLFNTNVTYSGMAFGTWK